MRLHWPKPLMLLVIFIFPSNQISISYAQCTLCKSTAFVINKNRICIMRLIRVHCVICNVLWCDKNCSFFLTNNCDAECKIFVIHFPSEYYIFLVIALSEALFRYELIRKIIGICRFKMESNAKFHSSAFVATFFLELSTRSG